MLPTYQMVTIALVFCVVCVLLYKKMFTNTAENFRGGSSLRMKAINAAKKNSVTPLPKSITSIAGLIPKKSQSSEDIRVIRPVTTSSESDESVDPDTTLSESDESVDSDESESEPKSFASHLGSQEKPKPFNTTFLMVDIGVGLLYMYYYWKIKYTLNLADGGFFYRNSMEIFLFIMYFMFRRSAENYFTKPSSKTV
jgi:hypothetical protein